MVETYLFVATSPLAASTVFRSLSGAAFPVRWYQHGCLPLTSDWINGSQMFATECTRPWALNGLRLFLAS